MTQRLLPSTTISTRSPAWRPVTSTWREASISPTISASSPDSVHRLSGAVVQSLVSARRTALAVAARAPSARASRTASFLSWADCLREADRDTTNWSRASADADIVG